jgi:hypothetical protein
MKVADGFEPDVGDRPIDRDMKAVEKVEARIADAVKKGTKIITGGKRAAQGSFFEQTLLTDVTTDMVITKEETFGPVAPLYRFKTEDEATVMANDAPTLPSPARGGGEGGGRLLFLQPRHRPHLARRQGPRIRHRRHQRGHHLA